jgi:phenylacetate-CoA ligase
VKVPTQLAEALYWRAQNARGRAGIRERLAFLQRTQELSASKINALQLEKLHQVISHAYRTVPYYRNIMQARGLRPEDVTTATGIRRLPLLTRAHLARHQPELVSSDADHATLQSNFSSGSTGVRAEFKQDSEFRLWMRAHQLRTYEWCANWRLGEPFVLLWGSEIYWSQKQLVDRLDNALSNRREFNTFRLSTTLIRRFLRKLQRFNPVLVSTYTNAVHLVAREAEQHGVNLSGLRAIQATSEPLPPAMRTRIASVFGCEVYDKYGMRETNIIAHESPSHDGMLMQSENVFVEFLRDDDEPCAPGERGRIVLTTLNNQSMPLIRYETTDIAAPLEGPDASGLGFPRMTMVAGRLQDLIVTPSGAAIDAYFFSYLIMRFREISWFQVVQQQHDRLLLRLYVPDGFSAQVRADLTEQIRHHTGYDFTIDYETLRDMPSSSTGKFRLCVSEIAAERFGRAQEWADD